MRTKHLLLFIAVLFTGGFTAINTVTTEESKMIIPDSKSMVDDDMQVEKGADKSLGFNFEVEDLQSIRQELSTALDESDDAKLNWLRIGPNNVAGRTRDIIMDQDNPAILYAGGAAGGIFKSNTNGQYWEPVETNYDQGVLSVTSIDQSPDGSIYYSTGDFFDMPNITKQGVASFAGGGVFKKAQDSDVFNQIPCTEPADNEDYFGITQIAIADDSHLYAATWKGLYHIYVDGDWTDEKLLSGYASDVQINDDGVIIAAVGGEVFRKAADEDSFQKVSGDEADQIASGGVRYEFDFAPSNDDYLYAIASNNNGSLKGIYRSTDAGLSWEAISVAGSDDFRVLKRIYRVQDSTFVDLSGKSSMMIAVDDEDPDYVYVGGVNMWAGYKTEGNVQFQWNQKTYNQSPKTFSLYLTTHQHQMIHHPNSDISYIACDGGVFRYDPTLGTTALNTYLTTGQYLDVNYGPEGEIIAGAQDNGVFYNQFNAPGSQKYYGTELLWDQDLFRFLKNGYQGAISQLSNRLVFYNHGYSQLRRSKSFGETKENFYSGQIVRWHTGDWYTFNNQMELWETNDYKHTQDTNEVENFQVYTDTTITIESNNIFGAPIPYQVDSIGEDTAIKFHDPYKGIFAFSIAGNVWITKGATSKTPITSWDWLNPYFYKQFYESDIKNTKVVIDALEITEDGNHLFFAVNFKDSLKSKTEFYRLDSLHNMIDSSFYRMISAKIRPKDTLYNYIQKLGEMYEVSVTSMVTNPNDPSDLILTMADYSDTDQVYLCDDANTTTATEFSTNFKSIQGNLPSIPVFDGCINVITSDTEPKQLLLGTEIGVWVTDNYSDAEINWRYDSKSGTFNGSEVGNLGPVPVMAIKQQNHNMNDFPLVENYGVFYIATYGKGIFVDSTYYIPPSKEPEPETDYSYKSETGIDVNVFPNPVRSELKVEFSLKSAGDVNMSIYDLSGKILYNENAGTFTEGQHKHTISTSQLETGIYFVNIKSQGSSQVIKIIKR